MHLNIRSIHIRNPGYKLIALMFIGLLIDFAFPKWHSLSIFHWSIVFILVLFIWSLVTITKNILILSNDSFSILKIAYLLLLFNLLFFIYTVVLSYTGTKPFLFSFHGNVLLTSFHYMWPYALVPLGIIIGITACAKYTHKSIIRLIVYFTFAVFIVSLKKHIDSGLGPMNFHGAFSTGYLSHVLLAYILTLLLNNHYTTVKSIIMGVGIIVLFLFPFYGALRGATAVSIITIVIIFVSYGMIGTRFYRIIGFIILATVIVLFFAKPVTDIFAEENKYGYRSLIDVPMSYTGTIDTAESRFEWWNDAVQSYLKSPIWGTAFSFRYYRDGILESAIGLHNYFLSTLVQGGLLLFIPLFLIISKSILKCINGIIRGKYYYVLLLAWLFAWIMLNISNTHIFLSKTGPVLSMMFGLTVGLISQNK